jgi:hypothetical protein
MKRGDRVKIVSVVGGEHGLYDKYVGLTGMVSSFMRNSVLVVIDGHPLGLWCNEVVPAFQETILPKELFEI